MNYKQECFCREYVIDSNGAAAAVRAGYSERTAKEQASRLLTNANVQAYISQLRLDIQERNKITVDEIVTELANMFRVDPKDIYEEDGTVRNLSDMTRDVRFSIKSIQITEQRLGEEGMIIETKRKVELYSKLDAAEKLMKHLGGYEKDNSQKQAQVQIIQVPDNGRS